MSPLPTPQTTASSFDTGPLSWVMNEIRDAVQRCAALAAEAAQHAPDARATALRQARAFLHQAHGALQVVDIDGVDAISGGLEAMLDRSLDGKLDWSAPTAALFAESATAVVEYLEELLQGATRQPVRLFPYHKAVQQACGNGKAHPSDLFFPDLSIKPQLGADPAMQAATKVDFASLRQRFERALLPFLKSTDLQSERSAAAQMAALVAEVERAQSSAEARGFWWVLRAFAEAVAQGEIATETQVKQLFGRINLQLRRLAEGSHGAVERLLRDALFFIAAAPGASGRAAQVRGAYQLEGQVPADYERRRYGQLDQAVLASAREGLNQAKNLWMRLVNGDASVAAEFEQQMQSLAAAGARLNAPSLEKLLRELNGIARAAHSQPGDALALEMAGSLLFVENALNHASRLSESFAGKAEALTARLLSVVAGEQPQESAEWLDELSRDAQQKETVAVLAGEMRVSLNQVEKGLEEFFADPDKRATLPTVDATLHQIEGALAILEQDDAAGAIAHTRAAVTEFRRLPAGQGAAPEQAQRLARNLGALSFFLETLQKQPATARERFSFDAASGSFHARLAEPLKKNVEVVIDPLPEAAQPAPAEPVAAAVAAEIAVPAPVLPPQAQVSTPFGEQAQPGMLPGTAPATSPLPDEDSDAELLDIFLGEAEEVLACISDTLPQLQAQPASTPCMTTVRRAFHTLKGSGRMVGLHAFGEAAWSIEQVLNLQLADGKPAHADLLALLGEAHRQLHAWVADVRATGHSDRSPDALAAAAARVKEGGPFVLDAADASDNAAPPDSMRIETQPAEDVLASDEGAIVVQAADLPDAPDFSTLTPEPEAPLALQEALPDSPALSNDMPVPEGDTSFPELTLDLGSGDLLIEPLDALPLAESAPSVASELAAPASAATDFPLSDPAGVPAAPDAGADIIDLAAVRAAPQPRPDDNIKRVGPLEISLPLYNIYLAETDDLVRLLAHDMDEWRHEPERPVNTASVHAAHSLSGSSATVGFHAVHEIAHALEMMLQALARRPVHLLASDFLLMRDAVARMKAMLAEFALGELAPEQPALVAALEGRLADLTLRPGLHDLVNDAQGADAAAMEGPADGADQLNESVVSQAPHSAAPDAAHSFAAQAQSSPPVDASPLPAVPALTPEVLPLTGLPDVADELDADLLPVFLEEGGDMLPQIGRALRAWQAAPADASQVAALLRLLHTIKGSARMAGAMRFGQQMHDMESRIEHINGIGAPAREAIDELLNRLDTAMAMFERLQRGEAALPAQPVPAPLEPVPALGAAALVDLPAGNQASTPAALDTPASSLQTQGGAVPVPLVRVRADVLDRLVNQAGEVSIARSRAESEIDNLRQSLADLTENVSRLSGQLREMEIQAESQMASQMASSSEREFDPLEFDRFTRLQELTRMMAESVNDVASLRVILGRALDNTDTALLNQARLTRELQQDLMRVRMVQFASIAERLYRVTRQTAKEVDKRINLDLRGGSVEVDRGVLEKMAGPFEHLLRNAIVHGIESRQARLAAGKPEIGQIQVEVRQEGNEVVIAFSDDGRGLDLERIRDRARAVGLLSEDDVPPEQELRELIFHPGLSTADEVTALAGRGIGMDAVRSEAAALGGRIEVHSQAGTGAAFMVRLPLTLAVTQVVLLSAGGRIFAVPSVLVEQVQQLKSASLLNAYNDNAVSWQGQRVPLHYLPALLGDAQAVPVTQQYSPVVIMKSGNERVAVHVDEVVGNREVVVKNIGPQLSRLVGIAGATVLGSGDIVMILNPVPLAQRAALAQTRAPRVTPVEAPQDMGAVAELQSPHAVPVQGLRAQPVVMVVDDSLTVRRVTQRLLLREGYQVVLAKDGVDALQQLQSITPDLMLLDIEMPRMDGFDLTRNMKSDTRTRDVPIIMITSRTAAKHRSVAMSLGVNEYLGKPYQEAQLLSLVKGFVTRETLA